MRPWEEAQRAPLLPHHCSPKKKNHCSPSVPFWDGPCTGRPVLLIIQDFKKVLKISKFVDFEKQMFSKNVCIFNKFSELCKNVHEIADMFAILKVFHDFLENIHKIQKMFLNYKKVNRIKIYSLIQKMFMYSIFLSNQKNVHEFKIIISKKCSSIEKVRRFKKTVHGFQKQYS